MSARRQLLDDIAKVAMSLAGVVQGAGKEGEGLVRHRLERLLDRMDLVPRDEFDVVKEMAAAARAENEVLKRRVEDLEAAIQAEMRPKKAPPRGRKGAGAPKTAAAKSAGRAAARLRKPRKTTKKSQA